MSEFCQVNFQWKNTDACYDLYCTCNPDFPQHHDGMFGQDFTCGKPDEGHDYPDSEWLKRTFCGKKWHLANQMYASAGPFFHDEPNTYGCEDCKTGHAAGAQACES